jgi:hypothetical protein
MDIFVLFTVSTDCYLNIRDVDWLVGTQPAAPLDTFGHARRRIAGNTGEDLFIKLVIEPRISVEDELIPCTPHWARPRHVIPLGSCQCYIDAGYLDQTYPLQVPVDLIVCIVLAIPCLEILVSFGVVLRVKWRYERCPIIAT